MIDFPGIIQGIGNAIEGKFVTYRIGRFKFSGSFAAWIL